MIDIQEARVRVALAEIEERRLNEKFARRSARWRLAAKIGLTIVVLVVGGYFKKTHLVLSAEEVGGMFLVYFISTIWSDYRVQEELHNIRAELERMRTETKNKTE